LAKCPPIELDRIAGSSRAHCRGADDGGIECARANELRVHEALVDIHQRLRRPPGRDPQPERIQCNGESEQHPARISPLTKNVPIQRRQPRPCRDASITLIPGSPGAGRKARMGSSRAFGALLP
jgi:hypothetical protein